MKTGKSLNLLIAVVSFVSLPVCAKTLGPAASIELTIYNDNFALVRETREADLEKGVTDIELDTVPALIEPTSVFIKSVNVPGSIQILEQNYEYDLLNFSRLLSKYVGQSVEYVDGRKSGKPEMLSARLLSVDSSISPSVGKVPAVLLESEGQIIVRPGNQLVLPSLPEGLILKPTLNWMLQVDDSGKQQLELSYLTNGIRWESDYVLVLNSSAEKADMTAWVTLNNQSGAAYKNAKVKLIAGDVNRVQQGYGYDRMEAAPMALQTRGGGQQFEEKSFSDYHLYTMQRKTSIKDNETKQVEMARASGFAVSKHYVFDGGMKKSQISYWSRPNMRERPNIGESEAKVAIQLTFENKDKNKLGMPLPKGRVRIYQSDETGGQEFVGEDRIDHTPKNEKVELTMGNAFDIVGERKQTSFRVVQKGKVAEESFEIEIRNQKAETATVDVIERMFRGRQWEILKSSHEYEKVDAYTVQFKLPVESEKSRKIEYRVRYTWE